MNMHTLREELTAHAEGIRYDVLREWQSTDSSTALEDLIYENIAYVADSQCIYTQDVRELVRWIEDSNLMGMYDSLLSEGMSRDDENTAIAYMFWSDNLHIIVNDMFDIED